MKYGRELLKGNLESLLLYLIKQKPLYGYQLIKEIEERSEGYFQFKEGTLYPALHRLEKSGLVRGKWGRSPSGLNRRYYYLTEKGERVLARKLAEWRSFSTAMNLVLAPANL